MEDTHEHGAEEKPEGSSENNSANNAPVNSANNAPVNPDQPLRTAEGRFQKGRSGNPKGRPPGARNRATQLEEVMRSGEQQLMAASPDIIKELIFCATHKDTTAQRLCLQRLYPAPRQRPIHIALPEIRSAADVADAVRQVVAAVARGEIGLDEGEQLLDLLAKAQSILTVSELADRVAKLEAIRGVADELKQKLLVTDFGTFLQP